MRIYGSRCIGMYTVNYDLKIDLSYSNFMVNAKSGDLMTKLSSHLKNDPNDIYITSITEGSTVVSGTISASSASNAQSLQSSMAGLSNSNILTEFPILAASTVIYYGDNVYAEKKKEPQSSTYNRTGLIVGVTIGSVAFVIIVGIIIYVLVKRHQDTQQKVEGISHQELEPSKNSYSRGELTKK